MFIFEPILTLILLVLFFVFVPIVLLAVWIAQYLLCSFALHRIAKQTGACKPGLAWIPFVQYWVLGKCAEACCEQCSEKDNWPLARLALITGIVRVCAGLLGLPQLLLILANVAFTLIFLLCIYKIYRKYLSSPADLLLTLLHSQLGFGNLGLFIVSLQKPGVVKEAEEEDSAQQDEGAVIDAELEV